MTVPPPMTIAVLGAGKIGQALARHWVAAGHRVVLGSRRPEGLVGLLAELGDAADARDVRTAARLGDVALLSVPHTALADLLGDVRPGLAGKIVVDATNAVTLAGGRFVSVFPTDRTSGRRTADLLPESQVCRGFSHVMDELLWSRGRTQRGLWAIAHAADSAQATVVVSGLITDAGFVPVDLGGLDDSAALDAEGVLFPHMFTEVEMRDALGADHTPTAASVATIGADA